MHVLIAALLAGAVLVAAAPAAPHDLPVAGASDIHFLRSRFKEDLDLEVPEEDLRYLVASTKGSGVAQAHAIEQQVGTQQALASLAQHSIGVPPFSADSHQQQADVEDTPLILS